jgi:hypothetical protein
MRTTLRHFELIIPSFLEVGRDEFLVRVRDLLALSLLFLFYDSILYKAFVASKVWSSAKLASTKLGSPATSTIRFLRYI